MWGHTVLRSTKTADFVGDALAHPPPPVCGTEWGCTSEAREENGARQRVHEFAGRSYTDAFARGSLRSFEPGVSKELIEDDGSAAFNKRYEELVERGP